MLLALAGNDVWTVLLGLGIVVTFFSTVAMIIGLTPARRPSTPHGGTPQVATPHATAPLALGSASSVRDRAAARAKAAAAAAAPPPSPNERSHTLTDVHVIRPTGQGEGPQDGSGEEPALTEYEANAIVAHLAEHDPARIAEVITQWIQSDQKPGYSDR